MEKVIITNNYRVKWKLKNGLAGGQTYIKADNKNMCKEIFLDIAEFETSKRPEVEFLEIELVEKNKKYKIEI